MGLKMNKRDFRKLLAENMRRFRTKNLNEQGGSLQQARNDEPTKSWKVSYNRPIMWPNVGGVTMWWQDFFDAIANHLAYYAEQIKRNSASFNDYATDIKEMYAAVKQSFSKAAVAFPWFNNIVRTKEKWLIEKINDDVLEELKQLLQNHKTYPIDVTIKNMQTLANKCQDVSEDMLHLGWDYGWQSDKERNAKQISTIAMN